MSINWFGRSSNEQAGGNGQAAERQSGRAAWRHGGLRLAHQRRDRLMSLYADAAFTQTFQLPCPITAMNISPMSTLKLYYAPKTRSTRPRWLLEEMGVPYDLIRINMAEKQHKGVEHRKIQPHGAVPALDDNGTVMFESAGILGYLAEKFPEKKMAPPLGSKERALYWQWLTYGVATLEVPIMAFFSQTVLTPEEKRIPQIIEESVKRFRDAAEVLNTALEGKNFLVANTF